ncbi:Tma108p NDAI_0B03920 [Naumovozyma dairenensis CBS 421]|uniref:Aminopeptidase n=1 Tax=Naumovozyma dairenensis (strain ATCC 10597 / BCRC 20456 / CBS 421 / NBRC 0211 / NRRL Y-12639) TaxID=1071378 RepID=G0W6L5_NAUDC|nr:hypothetical protein NDAI_0B03920 [Naumovozyma dairenensis CBS 421]CCD23426.1 hypothetical protein NDAI_0B03920 [Naumovozyma dairenensis CBS 421]
MATPLSIQNGFNIDQYNLQLDIDPSKTNFKGIVTIAATLLTNATSLKEIKLHSKNLAVTSAHILYSTKDDSKTNLSINYDEINQLVILKPENNAQSLSLSSTTFEIQLSYTGSINETSTYGVFKTLLKNNSKKDNFIIATHCQPSFARYIFPCIDELSSKSVIELSIITTKGLTVLSNAPIEQVVEKKSVRSNCTLTTFNKTPLMTTSLFGFVISNQLEVITAKIPSSSSSPESKDFSVSVYSPIRINDATFTLDTIQKYVPLLEKFFQFNFASIFKNGFKTKLDFVLLPNLADMAMENFGLIVIQMNHLLLTPHQLANDSLRNQLEQLIVHELVHQWIGNYISFDSWEHMWFNESFATWLAIHLTNSGNEMHEDSSSYWYDDQYLIGMIDSQLNNVHNHSLSSMTIHQNSAMIKEENEKKRKDILVTNDVFDNDSYIKGIIMLRSLQLTIQQQEDGNHVDLLSNAFASLFQQEKTENNNLHLKPCKLMDIWNQIGKYLKSENIPNFISSWTRLPGFPLLSVKQDEDDSKKTKLIQNRFLDGYAPLDKIENVPYHIPLLIKLPMDNKLDYENVLMTDRTLTLNHPIFLCNNESQAMYRVSYESEIYYDQFISNTTTTTTTIGGSTTLDRINLIKILKDLSAIINNVHYCKPIHIKGLFKITNHLIDQLKDRDAHDDNLWEPLSIAMSILLNLERCYSKYSGDYYDNEKKFNEIVEKLVGESSTINWELTKSRRYEAFELETLSYISIIFKNHPEIIKINEKYYDLLRSDNLKISGNLIPFKLIGSIFLVNVEQFTNGKQWKRFINYAKDYDRLMANVRLEGESSKEVQELFHHELWSYAGYTNKTEEVVMKVLNYIDSNLELELVPLILEGISSNFNRVVVASKKQESDCSDVSLSVGDIFWKWFMDNFNKWTNKCKNNKSMADNFHTLISIAFDYRSTESKNILIEDFIESYKGQEDIYKLLRTTRKVMKKDQELPLAVLKALTPLS